MAAVAEQYRPNRLVHELSQTPSIANTDSSARELTVTDFAVNAPLQTPPRSSNVATHAISTLAAPAALQAELSVQSTSKTIDGVVSEIKRETVNVRVSSMGEDLELSLPPSLFPADLLKYGAPVQISLDTSLGYRRPVVQSRAIAPQSRLVGQDAIDDWLRSN